MKEMPKILRPVPMTLKKSKFVQPEILPTQGIDSDEKKNMDVNR